VELELRAIVEDTALAAVRREVDGDMDSAVTAIVEGRTDPYTAAEGLLRSVTSWV
jgi:hypothetical protein